ncbi:hypothetical protein ACFSTE_09360 [Aquimarina hainanensis]|uniref:Uncharacterized protein n=1 Tax=Aquimarina hainanensis TaxID=1578017 RepID=A0ABW5NA24_9FLAO
MRPRISTKNIKFYLAQNYGYSNIDNFFKNADVIKNHKHIVIAGIIQSFTGYKLEKGKLVCYNPYTSKNEVLNISNFNHIQSKEDLLKELSMLHTTRMQMLKQSRKRILELSKQKTQDRDQDLKATIKKTESKRLQELQRDSKSKEEELDY